MAAFQVHVLPAPDLLAVDTVAQALVEAARARVVFAHGDAGVAIPYLSQRSLGGADQHRAQAKALERFKHAQREEVAARVAALWVFDAQVHLEVADREAVGLGHEPELGSSLHVPEVRLLHAPDM